MYWHIESAVTGTQVAKLTVWDDDGTSGEPLTRLILSPEISKTAPFDPTWQQATISPAVVLPAGNYWLGFHSGGTANVIRYAFESVSGSYRSQADTYADGTPTTFPANDPGLIKLAIVVEGTPTGGVPPPPLDTTKPTLLSAETLDPVFVQLQMSEALNVTNAPTAAAFTVKLDGVSYAPGSTTIAADIVTLDVGVIIPESAAVLVSYDKALATNKIKDLAGNEADSFTDQDVTNSVEPPRYERLTAFARVIDPTKRLVDPTNRIVGRLRPVWI
jgi:hypothetical protein